MGEVWWSLLIPLAGGGRDTMASRTVGLAELRRRLKEYYQQSKVSNRLPLKSLTLKKIKSGKHPKLKAKFTITDPIGVRSENKLILNWIFPEIGPKPTEQCYLWVRLHPDQV